MLFWLQNSQYICQPVNMGKHWQIFFPLKHCTEPLVMLCFSTLASPNVLSEKRPLARCAKERKYARLPQTTTCFFLCSAEYAHRKTPEDNFPTVCCYSSVSKVRRFFLHFLSLLMMTPQNKPGRGLCCYTRFTALNSHSCLSSVSCCTV